MGNQKIIYHNYKARLITKLHKFPDHFRKQKTTTKQRGEAKSFHFSPKQQLKSKTLSNYINCLNSPAKPLSKLINIFIHIFII